MKTLHASDLNYAVWLVDALIEDFVNLVAMIAFRFDIDEGSDRVAHWDNSSPARAGLLGTVFLPNGLNRMLLYVQERAFA